MPDRLRRFTPGDWLQPGDEPLVDAGRRPAAGGPLHPARERWRRARLDWRARHLGDVVEAIREELQERRAGQVESP